MNLTLVAGEVGRPTSGQSRFLLNLSKGLRAEGVQVQIAGSFVDPATAETLAALGIRSASLTGRRPRGLAQARLMTRLPGGVGPRVAALAVAHLPADWYVVLSDAIVDAVDALPSERSVFVTQGDLALLFVSPPFYSTHPIAKSWLSRGMAPYLRRNGARARRYRRVLANSEFTRHLLSYLYACPIHGVLSPPVDTDRFTPGPAPPGPPYVLSIARNAHEQGLTILEAIAAKVPVKVVGGARVRGAESVGEVTDEQLIALYRGARLFAAPAISELFGYGVAESHACGTPAIAFDVGGPAEQIASGVNGWLVRSEEEFVSRTIELISSGYPHEVREHARTASERFGLRPTARRLMAELESAERSA